MTFCNEKTRASSLQRTPLYRVVGAAVGVRLTRFSLRTMGFHRTITLFSSVPQSLKTVEAADPIWAQEIAYVSGWRYGASCLDRSVFLWFLLAQHSIEGDLKIGISANDNGIDGHAWVEHQGRVLNDRHDIADDFAVFQEDPVGIVFR